MRIAKNDIRRALTIAKANAKKGSSLSGDAGFKTIQRVFENRIPFTAHHGYLPHVSHCGEKGSLSKFQKRLSLLDWLLFQRNLSEISNHGKEERLLKLLPVSACILVKKDFQEISCHGEKSTLSAIWEMSYDSIWQGVRKEVLDCRSTSQVSKDPALEKSIQHYRSRRDRGWHRSQNFRPLNVIRDFSTRLSLSRLYSSDAANNDSKKLVDPEIQDHSQRAVTIALWCNFLVFCLKCGVWAVTGSHVMLAETVHSLADIANQALLAYGLVSSRRAPDELHPYGYSKERFVWSLISAVGIFCLGSGATIVDGFSNLWTAERPENISIAAMVLAGSMIIEGVSLLVAIKAVKNGASAEGMSLWDYCWRGHDPTAVAVMMEDGAAVAGLVIASMSLIAVSITGNPIYDPIGSIFVGNLLGMVAVFLIQRNRHALLGRAMDNQDMKLVLDFLASDPVVDAVYDCKSEVIGPRSYRFKAEIDFNGVVIVQNYLKSVGRDAWAAEFRQAVNGNDGLALDRAMSNYGEEVVLALGSEVDRLEREIQRLVPGIRYVDIETHNPNGPTP